jgi:hypothetical protein
MNIPIVKIGNGVIAVEIPIGYLSDQGLMPCKECGTLFEHEGKKQFCNNKCKNRWASREFRKRKRS